MKFSTGIFDSMFGAKMTIQIKQENGIMKDVVVTKAWWENMKKGKEGVFKVVRRGSQTATAHILDPQKPGYTQETWTAGVHIKLEDMEKCSENGNLFVIDYYDKGIPQRKVVSRSDWIKAEAHFDKVVATAQNNLERLYEEGKGVPEDFAKARKWNEQAAVQGNAPAQYALGMLYFKAQGMPQDYVKARQWLEKAATQGHAQAQFQLGWLYDKGQGVAQDYKEAVRWYHLAAEQGAANARLKLGFMYANGLGASQDFKEAARWYQLEAKQGNAFAQFALGTMYGNGQGVPQDDTEQVRWYRLAAEQGEVRAKYNLGVMYSNGTGVPQDDLLAHMWFNLAAAQGDEAATFTRDRIAKKMTAAQITEAQKLAREWKPGADVGEKAKAQQILGQQLLGNIYYKRQDYANARQNWEKAATHGDAIAQAALGTLCYGGQGAPQDYAKAREWYEQAAAQGNADAQAKLGQIYANGLGVSQNYTQARDWSEKAAAQGNALAQHDLGLMYFIGAGIPQNFVQAHMWLILAAANLVTPAAQKSAADRRDETARCMTPAQVAEAQRLAREWKPKTERTP